MYIVFRPTGFVSHTKHKFALFFFFRFSAAAASSSASLVAFVIVIIIVALRASQLSAH